MAHIPPLVTGFGRNALSEILKGGAQINEVGTNGITGQTDMLVIKDGKVVAEFTKEEMSNVNLNDPQMRRELGY